MPLTGGHWPLAGGRAEAREAQEMCIERDCVSVRRALAVAVGPQAAARNVSLTGGHWPLAGGRAEARNVSTFRGQLIRLP